MSGLRRYGVPYLGSKNDIAEWVVSHLPPADVLIDAFAGGCAVTHAALLSGRFKRIIVNDINDTPQLFLDAINGKYHDETRWISREDFAALKGSDPYVRQLWSYGNAGDNYLYSEHIEPYKRAYHYAAILQDFEPFTALGIDVPADVRKRIGGGRTAHQRRLMMRRWILENEDMIRAALIEGYTIGEGSHAGDLQSFERLERLQSFERLERLQSFERLERLQSFERLVAIQGDYSLIPLPTQETYTIYCDPPYKGTCCGSYAGFDHDRFYDWLRHLDHPAIVSEYNMPDDFIEIDRCTKMVKSAAVTTYNTIEKLFVHKSQYDRLPRTSLFDSQAFDFDTPPTTPQHTQNKQ